MIRRNLADDIGHIDVHVVAAHRQEIEYAVNLVHVAGRLLLEAVRNELVVAAQHDRVHILQLVLMTHGALFDTLLVVLFSLFASHRRLVFGCLGRGRQRYHRGDQNQIQMFHGIKMV